MRVLSHFLAVIVGVGFLSFPSPASFRDKPAGRAISAASSRERRVLKPACGSSPRPRICRRNFIKIVVTDDQGRFMLPELPTANYKVWVRGYGLVDSTPVDDEAGRDARHAEGDHGEDAAGSREGLSRQLLAVADGAAADEHVPGTGTAGQRHRPDDADAEPLDQLAEVGLQLLPSARQPADAHVDHVFKAKPELKTHARGLGLAARHAACAATRCTACSSTHGQGAHR